jgi:hypothetical protein
MASRDDGDSVFASAAYASLGLSAALRRDAPHFTSAALELSTLLRHSAKFASKACLTLMFTDSLLCCQLLAHQHGGRETSAACLEVCRAAQSSLAASRGAAVAASHKQACLLLKKSSHASDSAELSATLDDVPIDVLVCHVFAVLDARSLGRAACVCKSWRAATASDKLWRPHVARLNSKAPSCRLLLLQLLASQRNAFSPRLLCSTCKRLLWRRSDAPDSMSSCELRRHAVEGCAPAAAAAWSLCRAVPRWKPNAGLGALLKALEPEEADVGREGRRRLWA